MEWYYVERGERVGPIGEEKLQQLVQSGQITRQTLVWNPAMANWQPYGQAAPGQPGGAGPLAGLAPIAEMGVCADCGRQFPTGEMIGFGDRWVCADCKPLFFQRLKEGALTRETFVYGGFWIRFGARFIDGLILFAVGYFSSFASGGMLMMNMLWGFVIGITYSIFFLGRFGQTPGMMACGLRVVRPDGQRITYLRAFGRYFADMLSQAILCIGFIMVAFDDEKRALHDRICDTRVIRINN